MGDEADEHAFLKEVVFNRLIMAGLMTGKYTLQIISRKVLYNGRPDDFGVKPDDDEMSSIIQVKTSHNLLIPNAVVDVCERYQRAFDLQNDLRKGSRSLDWSRIGHPLAQLLGYMIDNRLAYGALCSASKTYFARLEKSTHNDKPTIDVQITKAYQTCERDYLRAWAFFFRLSNDDENLRGTDIHGAIKNTGWRLSIPLHHPQTRRRRVDDQDDDDEDDDNGSNGNGNKSSATTKSPRTSGPGRNGSPHDSAGRGKKAEGSGEAGKANSMRVPDYAIPPPFARFETPDSFEGSQFTFDFEDDFVPFVKYEGLQDKTFLAESRNGVVFSALVNGERYAVKQFDLSKNFEGYVREIAAYKHLHGAWGDLVPKPHFLSTSPTGNVRFLVMTQGDERMGIITKDLILELQNKLIEKFNFRHLDNSHGRNYITFKGKLMMIDFEEWEDFSEQS